MIKYDKLWVTMKSKGVTQYDLTQKYNLSKSLLHRLRNNEASCIIKNVDVEN